MPEDRILDLLLWRVEGGASFHPSDGVHLACAPSECTAGSSSMPQVLQDGDIVNVDVTVYHQGYHGDCSETFCIGNVSCCPPQLMKRHAFNAACW